MNDLTEIAEGNKKGTSANEGVSAENFERLCSNDKVIQSILELIEKSKV